jgi:hypothetical protein
MASQGTTTVNFGAFPGKTDATVTITGQAGILAGSLVEAFIYPTATADHSADEHWVDPPRIMAGNIVAGTGFTIYCSAKPADANQIAGNSKLNVDAPMVYGQWTIGWVWN